MNNFFIDVFNDDVPFSRPDGVQFLAITPDQNNISRLKSYSMDLPFREMEIVPPDRDDIDLRITNHLSFHKSLPHKS